MNGKPVTVMEPCKGGTLVNLPEEAEKLLRSYAPDASNASWALRFAASQPEVTRVLSGMNTMEQVLDNTALTHGRAGECIGCKQCEKACSQLTSHAAANI